MDRRAPVYTEPARCQDCYKCVRECPVKAIRVHDGCAQVVAEECVTCGHCVGVCPAGAKRVRDDLPAVRALIAAGRRVVCSLAPSWPAGFPGLEAARLVAALRRLGFHSASETARGAQEVSAHVAQLIASQPPRLWLSSACPAAVDYLKKAHPALGACVTDLLSPMLAHARMLRAHHGPDAAIVFVGPCIAKKREAEAFPGLVDACLTFADLAVWLEAEGIVPAACTPGAGDAFAPFLAREGTLYPIEGGMIAGIKAGCRVHEPAFLSVSGLEDIGPALAGLEGQPPAEPLFVELLACRGGCINGPGMGRDIPGGLLTRRLAVIHAAREDGRDGPRQPTQGIAGSWRITPLPAPVDDQARIRAALAQIGKTASEDEFNCGGCGYETCRELASALAAGRAEPAMCVSYMRRLAQGKAEALMGAMPAAAVLVDDALRVVECNRAFARLLGTAAETRFAAGGGLAGEAVAGLAPLARRLRAQLAGQPVPGGELRLAGAVFTASLFTVEAGRLVGAVLTDITAPAGRRAEVAERARKVIERNLETVQRIAFLLGENAAETEGMLTTLADSLDEGDDPPPPG